MKMEFKENIKISFQKVRNDFNAIKQNVTDWIFSINKRQTVLEHKLKVMEARVRQLERAQFQKSFGGNNGRVF